MKTITLLQLHKEWLRTGCLPDTGLCLSLPHKYLRLLELFKPTLEDSNILFKEHMSTFYWASDLKFSNCDKSIKYTELRQTIVLFIIEISKSTKKS